MTSRYLAANPFSPVAQSEQVGGVLFEAVRVVLQKLGPVLRCFDCSKVELGESRQIDVEVRQHVVLAGIRCSFHWRQIPKQIVNDKTPWQEVVYGEVLTKLLLRVDVAELGGPPCRVEIVSHEPPEVTSCGELPCRRGAKLLQHTRHVRVSRLQVEREVMVGEGLNEAEIFDQEGSP